MIQAPWVTHILNILERKVAIHPFEAWGLVYNNNNDFGTENFLRVNEWLASINSPNRCLKSINSFQLHLIYRKFFVHPAITASISHTQKMNGCFIGTWGGAGTGGGNLVPIVCGLQAIITLFQAHFLHFFFFSFSFASICFSSSSSSSSWPSRLALIPLLFIVHSVNLIILVIPYLNVSSSRDWELHEVRVKE